MQCDCAATRTNTRAHAHRRHTQHVPCLLEEVDGVEAVKHAEGARDHHREIGEQQHLPGSHAAAIYRRFGQEQKQLG